MPAPGNHEYQEDPAAAGYYGYFGAAAGDPAKGYYDYTLGSWHIIVLNSNCSPVGGCRRAHRRSSGSARSWPPARPAARWPSPTTPASAPPCRMDPRPTSSPSGRPSTSTAPTSWSPATTTSTSGSPPWARRRGRSAVRPPAVHHGDGRARPPLVRDPGGRKRGPHRRDLRRAQADPPPRQLRLGVRPRGGQVGRHRLGDDRLPRRPATSRRPLSHPTRGDDHPGTLDDPADLVGGMPGGAQRRHGPDTSPSGTTASMPSPRLNTRTISSSATPPASATTAKMRGSGHDPRRISAPRPSGRTRLRFPGIPPPVTWAKA